MPNSRRGKQRGHRTASRPPNLESSVRGLLRDAIAGVGEVMDAQDPLEVELWTSPFVADWYGDQGDPWPEALAETVVPGGLVAAAEHQASNHALALLRAIAATSPADIGGDAAAAAERLASNGVTSPPWANVVGHPDLLGAWLVVDPFGDADIVLLSYRYAGCPVHAMSILVDHNLGGIVKDVAVLQHRSTMLETMRRDPEVIVREITAEEAGRRLRSALRDVLVLGDPSHEEDTRVLMPLVVSRVRLLPGSGSGPDVRVPTAAERADLIVEYLGSGLAPDVGDAGAFAELFVDYKCDQLDGDPLRWSPVVLELFLCDYAPRKLSAPDEIMDAVPVHLRHWLTFTGRRRELPEHLLDQMLAALEDHSVTYRQAIHDTSRFGSSKRLVAAMEAEGVDLHDQEAIDAWIDSFNARPIDERGRILGLGESGPDE